MNNNTPFTRLRELLKEDCGATAGAEAAHIHVINPTVSEYDAYQQLSGNAPMTTTVSETIAKHAGLDLAAGWLHQYLTEQTAAEGSVLEHVRTVRKLVGAGHTWRRIIRG
jgi:hypothetical protein